MKNSLLIGIIMIGIIACNSVEKKSDETTETRKQKGLPAVYYGTDDITGLDVYFNKKSLGKRLFKQDGNLYLDTLGFGELEIDCSSWATNSLIVNNQHVIEIDDMDLTYSYFGKYKIDTLRIMYYIEDVPDPPMSKERQKRLMDSAFNLIIGK